MTTSVVCVGGIKSKPRLYRSPEPCRMDPHFIQLESQLAALRNQRHPMAAARFPTDATPVPAKFPTSPSASSKHDLARKSDTDGMAGSSSSSLESSSSLAMSPDTTALHAEAAMCSLSPSLPSSSCSVDSTEKHDARDNVTGCQQTVYVAHQSLTTAASELDGSSEQRQSNGVTHHQRHLSSSSSVAVRRRSIQSINEERSRFRIVKIDSYVDRGRWHCHNFADPPMHDDDMSSSAQYDSGTGASGDADDTSGPSQIYYIAAGQNDGDLSEKFYVSAIVYGVHGHPVLDRTVRMSPLQLLRHASDDSLSQAETGDTLTPTPRGNDSNQSPTGTMINNVGEIDMKLPTASCHYDDVLPIDDDGAHVESAPETSDVMENDPGSVAMAAHSSMPPTLTSCSSQSMTSVTDNDDVSRRAMTSLSLSHQDDVEIRCHSDSAVQPANGAM